MKREILRSIVCLGTISLVGTGAFGQAAGGAGQDRQDQQQQRGQSGISGQSQGNLGRSSTQAHGSMQSQLLRFSQLIGANIQSSQGSSLGQVRDLAVDPQSGRIEMALVSLSSSSSTTRSTTPTPGTSTSPTNPNQSATDPNQRRSDLTTTPGSTISGRSTSGLASDMGKLVAVPWQLLRASHPSSSGIGSSTTTQTPSTTTTPGSIASGTATMASTPTLTFTGEESKLKDAPSFDYSTFTGANQSMFAQRVYSHYGLDYNNRQSGIGGAGSGISSGADRSTDLNRPDSNTTKPDRDKDKP